MDALRLLQIRFGACCWRRAYPFGDGSGSGSPARELYALEATARALAGEYDDNFQLTSGDGHGFVLKVMHPAREQSFIDMQCRALRHLAERAPQLPLPRVISNQQGELFSSTLAADGSTRLVWLLSFVNGTVLAEVRPHTPELLGDLGRFLGKMDAALQSFTHAAAHRELKWDSSRAGWIKDYIKHIVDLKRRALVESFWHFMKRRWFPTWRDCGAA